MTEKESIVGGMAGRYASALFDLAKEQNALDAVMQDLSRFGDLVAGSRELALVVRSPVFSKDEKHRAVGAILAKLGVHALTAKFVGVVIANRRLFAIRDIAAAYAALLADYRGEVTARVVSAKALSSAQQAQLQSTLKGLLGRTVSLKETVDPSLLGGLVVKVGSRMIDSSLATKLNNIQLAMREA